MSNALYQSSRDYRALVRRLNNVSPGYHLLHEFVNIKLDTVQTPTRFTLLTINSESTDEEKDVEVTPREFEGTKTLTNELVNSQSQKESCNIFLVENICPATIALIGGFFDINPQFFADHVKNGDWFKDQDLMDHIPALPSSQKWHDFLQVRFIQTLAVAKPSPSTLELNRTPTTFEMNKGIKGSGGDTAQHPSQDYLEPDETITRLPRKAGKMIPRARDDRNLELLLCTKQSITVWFGKKKLDDVGWNGKCQCINL